MKKFIRNLTAFILVLVTLLSTGIFTCFASTLRSGDLDGDGKVTASDARSILRLSVELTDCVPVIRQYADTNGDEAVTAADARLALRVSVKLEEESSLASFVPEDKDEYFYPEIREITLTEGEKTEAPILVRKDMKPVWKSTNTKAVTVSKNGQITAAKKGFSCVILECDGYKFYFEINVRTPLQNKIDALRSKYPEGYYWNNHEPSKKYPAVTETPCSDHREGKYAYCKGQCAGFAELMFKEVFGSDAKRTYGVTWDTLKIGDYIRFNRNHSVFVTDVVRKGDIIGYSYYREENITAEENYIVVVHCNWHWNCDIVWDGVFYEDYTIAPGYSYTAY